MTCHFCKEPAVGACAWPITALDLVTFGDLKVGDVIARSTLARARETILHIRPIMPGGPKTYMLELTLEYTLPSARTAMIATAARPIMPAYVERERACGVPVCDAHHMDRGEVAHCQTHWHAWELVA